MGSKVIQELLENNNKEISDTKKETEYFGGDLV
jgi:hypothetical protein